MRSDLRTLDRRTKMKEIDFESTTMMMSSRQISGYDEDSKIWLEEFSLLLDFMFPVEYIFHEWYQGLEFNQLLEHTTLTGSTLEGFSIPNFCFIKNPELTPENRDLWQSDHDSMSIESHMFQSSITGLDHPIFSVEHCIDDDPRYVKLRITKDFHCEFPQFKNIEHLNHAYMFNSNKFIASEEEAKQQHTLINSILRRPIDVTDYNSTQDMFVREVHGPVFKESQSDLILHERDFAALFAYPDAWPEGAMEWLDRPAIDRPNNWPSHDLIKEISEAGCLIAAVGRGTRIRYPKNRKDYLKSPEDAVVRTNTEKGMDETEWRVSFSIAENKLAASVSPFQRHVMVLLKMLKKMYFSDISTYLLKNLAFWEFQRKDGSFWNENNTAVCLLFLLDQLIKCLKEGSLPQYIMPLSNLLKGEDPAVLAKAAKEIIQVRKNILQRTLSMLNKLYFVRSERNLMIKEFNLENICEKIENRNIKDEERLVVKKDICNALAKKYTDLTLCSHKRSYDVEISMFGAAMTEISKLICKSVLARLFCKIYDLNLDQRSIEDIVIDGTKDLPNANEIITQSKEYLREMANANDLSTFVPSSASMIDVRKMHRAQILSWKLSSETYRPNKQINDFLNIVKKNIVEKKFVNLRGLDKVKLIAMTMLQIEDIMKKITK